MNTIIISLGGSIISTDADTTAIVQDYATWLKQLAHTNVVAVIVGGGYRARVAIEEAKKNDPNLTNDQLDEIGIAATRVNAELLRSVCQVERPMMTDPNIILPTTPCLIFGAGWKPGRSTDYDAVLLAVTNNVTTVYNVSNITKIYTADPKTDPAAKPLDDVTWEQLQQIVGDTWTPGLNMPFDPIAAKLATEHGLTVKVVNGLDMANLANCIAGQAFVGTVIHK